MEEQNKYYTPDISELHVGWEGEACFSSYAGYAIIDFSTDEKSFELHEPEDKEAAKYWSKFWLIEKESLFTDNNTRNHETALMLLKDNRLRGKYLHQSDIESLGWEFDKSRGIPLEYHYTKEVNLKKYKLTKLSTKIHIGILQQGNTLYEGECKSINELRKIMEWLNIK
jgi:hypothetical protein